MRYLPIGAVIALFVAGELGYVALGWSASPQPASGGLAGWTALSNTAALGGVLYTRYFYFFQAAGNDPADRDDRRRRQSEARLTVASTLIARDTTGFN